MIPIDDQTWLTGIIKASDLVMFQQSPSLELPSQSIANMIWNILAKYFDVDGPRHAKTKNYIVLSFSIES